MTEKNCTSQPDDSGVAQIADRNWAPRVRRISIRSITICYAVFVRVRRNSSPRPAGANTGSCKSKCLHFVMNLLRVGLFGFALWAALTIAFKLTEEFGEREVLWLAGACILGAFFGQAKDIALKLGSTKSTSTWGDFWLQLWRTLWPAPTGSIYSTAFYFRILEWGVLAIAGAWLINLIMPTGTELIVPPDTVLTVPPGTALIVPEGTSLTAPPGTELIVPE